MVLFVITTPCMGQEEPRPNESFLERIGFTAGVDAGYSVRFNGYSTYEPLLQTQIPVEFDTKTLSVLDLHVEAGVMEGDFVEFDYQSSVPRTDFQQEALAYREDRSFGLDKYTFGIDTTPLWLLILPDDASWAVKRILALRFRSVRELSQSHATVTEPSLGLPSDPIDNYGDVASFDPLDSGTAYSFKTRYRYNSVSLPLLFFVKNRGRLNVGVARWSFSRSYAASLPSLNNRQVVFSATNRTNAIVAEMYIDLNRGALQGFEMDLFYGYGLDSEWDGQDVDVDRLFIPTGDTELDITNHNYEFRVSYPFTFFQKRDRLAASVKVGLLANTFTTSFSNFDGAQNQDDDFKKRDWIINPSVRLSLSY